MIRIDRLEEFFAVCEDRNGNLLHLPRTDLPETVREGDCLIRTETGWQVEEEETRQRRKSLSERFRRLFHRKNEA